jgi:RHS repeat-associated protein
MKRGPRNDGEGNMIKRTEIATGDYREFVWDHRNRLTEINDFLLDHILSQTVRYTYDAVNRRISMSTEATPLDSEDISVLIIVYDREDIRFEFAGQADGAAPTLGSRYFHGPGIDQVFSEDVDTAVQWLLSDHLGTNRDIVDNNATMISHIQVDSQGNPAGTRGAAVSMRFTFTGREFDAETQLYYHRARYYDAAIGRFSNEDTSRWLSSDINLFRYALNAPTSFTDPYGTDSITGEFIDKPAVTDIDVVPVPGSERYRLRLNPGGKWGIGFYEEQLAVSGTVSARIRCTKPQNAGRR